MPSLKAIKKRISSVKSTQKITKAMKLVSAAKLRRATEKAQSSRPYETQLKDIISAIFQEFEFKSELTTVRAERKKMGIVVISTDRGLAGSLNANIFKAALKRMTDFRPDQIEVIAMGKKAGEFFKKRGYHVTASYSGLVRNPSHTDVAAISKTLQTSYLKGELDRVEVFYSQFQSAIVQVPTQFCLLPFVPEKSESTKQFILEPSARELLQKLIPMLIDFQLYRFLLENIACEHGARMSAMESATNNARDMIERLTLQRNRARQAAITKELMEIIGGAEALAA